MANSYLDKAGLGILWNKIKALIPQPTTTSSENPKMDGTAAIGSSSKYARADHVHPSDTSRVPTTRKVNGKKLSSDINLIAEDIGYDNGGVTTVKSWIDKQAEIESFNASTGVVKIGGYVGGDTLSYASTSFYNKTAIDGFFSQAGTALDNKLEGVQVNGTDLTITNKKVDVPVAKDSQYGVVKIETMATVNQPSPYGESYKLTAHSTNGTETPIYLLKSVSDATTSYKGLMSAADKTKLNAITITNGVIDSSCLPSFVDDVIEVEGKTGTNSGFYKYGTTTEITGESGKIYVLMSDFTSGSSATQFEPSTTYHANSQFRWGGTKYILLNDSSGISAITETEINAICV